MIKVAKATGPLTKSGVRDHLSLQRRVILRAFQALHLNKKKLRPGSHKGV